MPDINASATTDRVIEATDRLLAAKGATDSEIATDFLANVFSRMMPNGCVFLCVFRKASSTPSRPTAAWDDSRFGNTLVTPWYEFPDEIPSSHTGDLYIACARATKIQGLWSQTRWTVYDAYDTDGEDIRYADDYLGSNRSFTRLDGQNFFNLPPLRSGNIYHRMGNIMTAMDWEALIENKPAFGWNTTPTRVYNFIPIDLDKTNEIRLQQRFFESYANNVTTNFVTAYMGTKRLNVFTGTTYSDYENASTMFVNVSDSTGGFIVMSDATPTEHVNRKVAQYRMQFEKSDTTLPGNVVDQIRLHTFSGQYNKANFRLYFR